MSTISLPEAMRYSCRSTAKPEAAILWLAMAIVEHVESKREPGLWALALAIADAVRPMCEPLFVRHIELLTNLDTAQAARH